MRTRLVVSALLACLMGLTLLPAASAADRPTRPAQPDGATHTSEVRTTSDETVTVSTPLSDPEPRIVGGEPAPEGAYPWMARLSMGCGATLIHPEWLLSAAHCGPSTSTTARIGLTDLNDPDDGISRGVSQVIIHPDYTPPPGAQWDNDFALLRLDEPVTELEPIPLATPDDEDLYPHGTNSRTMGWGATSPGGPSSDILLQVDVPIADPCGDYDPDDITDNMICAGLPEGGQDACQGDSGGPLILPDDDDGDHLHIGIVSWGNSCALPNFPGVYARTSVMHPEPDGGAYVATAGQAIRLSVDGDPFGLIDDATWDLSDAGIAEPVTGANPVVTVTQVGTFDIVVTVFTEDGRTGTGTGTITTTEPGEDPAIAVTPDAVSLAADFGDSDSAELVISNAGLADLEWDLTIGTTDCDTPLDGFWLTATPTAATQAFGEFDIVTVVADGRFVPPGLNEAILCLDSNDPAEPLVEVPVAFDHADDPTVMGNFREVSEVDTGDLSGSWTDRSIDLAAWAGEEACLAFVYRGGDGHVWFIDDVEIGDVAESFEDPAFPPTDWQALSLGASSAEEWLRTTDDANTGAASAWHDWASAGQDIDSWLITPPVTLGDNASLDYADRTADASFYTYGGVWISTGSCDPLDPDPEVVSITVEPTSVAINAEETAAFTATAVYDDDSTVNVTDEAAWSTDDTAVAVVDTGGVATGVGDGTTLVVASFGGRNGAGQITVTDDGPDPELVEVVVDPDAAEIEIGETVGLTATAVFDDGTQEDVTAAASWSSADETVTTVTVGLVTGVAEGVVEVTATIDGESDSAVITVTDEDDDDPEPPGPPGEPGPPDPGEPGPPDPGEPLPEGVFRVSGSNRFETAVNISQATFGDGEAGSVVLARGDEFADALAGTPLAVEREAPTLLTVTDTLIDIVGDEIVRVLPPGGTVYLLGGTAALGPEVEAQLAALGYTPVRLAGPERIGTSVAIADELAGDLGEILITTGFNFPDALAAGAAAAEVDGVVVLTTSETADAQVDAFLAANPDANVTAVGGPAARAYPGATAVFGATREETAAAVAEVFFTDPVAVALARQDDYPDALAGGAHIARLGGPLLLTPDFLLHPATEAYACANAESITTGFVYGGTQAVSDEVLSLLGSRIDGGGCF